MHDDLTAHAAHPRKYPRTAAIDRRALSDRASQDAMLSVTCPHCGASPGAYCRNRGGYTVPPHKARERAADVYEANA